MTVFHEKKISINNRKIRILNYDLHLHLYYVLNIKRPNRKVNLTFFFNLVNPLSHGRGGGAVSPPPVVFCPLLKKSLGIPENS